MTSQQAYFQISIRNVLSIRPGASSTAALATNILVNPLLHDLAVICIKHLSSQTHRPTDVHMAGDITFIFLTQKRIGPCSCSQHCEVRMSYVCRIRGYCHTSSPIRVRFQEDCYCMITFFNLSVHPSDSYLGYFNLLFSTSSELQPKNSKR